ncbi:MAG TPA: enoyl-CoA hydratase-related protein [Polyangia bacterium]|nr:enoyl-CoA hydratase-related protein [Polyangia bacterium]
MIETVEHGTVRELRLARPPVNALDPALLRALRRALREATAAGREAIVLSGSPGRFSGGLDVPALLSLDRAGILDAWRTFFALMRDLAASPVPVAAALTGHSPAGGTVLALFADHRVLAGGDFLVGLNEVRVGLPVPEVLLRALAYTVGERQAARLAVGGLLVPPEEALRVGLVDEVAPVAEVVPRAVAWAQDLLGRPRAAMTATRALARRPLVAAFDAIDDRMLGAVADQWFSPEAQSTLRALAARLKKG